MLRIVSCLTTQHDWRLVLLAGAVCFLTSLAAINLFYRASATAHRDRLLWLLTTSAATGYGIWATHFIAMLAYTPGIPTGYDLSLTVASLFAAWAITGAGFALAVFKRSLKLQLASGGIVGLGVAVMHYTGMAALEVQGHVNWSTPYVVASIVLGAAFAAAAMHLAVEPAGRRTMLGAAGLLTLAIVSHHFTAMAAAELVPDPTVVIAPLSLSPWALSMTIASGAVAVLGISLMAAVAGHSRQQLIDASEGELARQAELFQAAVMNMSQGLCMFDRDQHVVVANRRYSEIYGLDPALVKRGTTLREILEARVANGAYAGTIAVDFVEAGVASFNQETEQILELTDGRTIAVVRKPTVDGGIVSTHEDITERRRAEAQIAHLAHHDVLTDLPNRALLRDRLNQAGAAIKEGGRRLALLALDLDRFKEVNDTLGHPVGDALLKAVAQRLQQCVRDTDTIARLGGDEFVIVQRTANPEKEAQALAQRLLESISAPYELMGHSVVIGTSIGVAIAPTDGDTGDLLMRNADLALYRSKTEGRGVYRFFQQEMDQKMQERRQFERDLREALREAQFVVHYQPLVNAGTEQICGFEALLRWQHPDRGMVPPSAFIPVAEETGMIVQLGEWVLRQACTEAAGWPDSYKIAVNVSAAQFKARNFLEVVVRTLAVSGMRPHRLELEVTESLMFDDDGHAFETLRSLQALGVRIALDDFGTGYSSLSNLRKFPFNKIKIDRSFVSDLSVANLDALAVVRSVAQLGVSLGMATTAEGVETREQFDQVRAEGCTEIQGYYICRPSPAAEIERRFIDKGWQASAA
jgi:diguanylate cyclase (GGDEF)-like protein